MAKSSESTTVRSGGVSAFVSITSRAGALVAQPVGPALAEREASIVDSEVMAALQSAKPAPTALVLDLSRLTFISSLGLSMCINARNRAKAVKAKTIVFGLNAELLSVFKMVKLDRVFQMAGTAAELEKALAR
jgi:anti-anti-sigma factor